MAGIIEYVEKNMNGMALNQFNAADSLVLSQLSYIHFDPIVPFLSEKLPSVRIGDLLKAEMFDSMFRDVRDVESNRRLLFALAASPRFRNIQMCYYVDKADTVLEKQFSAVTFFLEDNTAYIAYRGTDSTINGWKEDFNMAFITPVPSQVEGVLYLNEAAKRIPRKMQMRTGGHSKGGNIAVYSAMKCNKNVQSRIVGIFNHDGPGFKDSVFESPEFLRIEGRIHTTIPESSLIGMMLQYHENYMVVKSSRYGIMQHDPFSWLIENENFLYAEDIKSNAMYRNKTLNQWLNTLSDEKRKTFVDALFQVLDKTDSATVNELTEDWKKAAMFILGAIKNIDPETRKFVFSTVNELVKLSFKNLRSTGK